MTINLFSLYLKIFTHLKLHILHIKQYTFKKLHIKKIFSCLQQCKNYNNQTSFYTVMIANVLSQCCVHYDLEFFKECVNIMSLVICSAFFKILVCKLFFYNFYYSCVNALHDMQLLRSIKDCFVTGSWADGEDAVKLLANDGN